MSEAIAPEVELALASAGLRARSVRAVATIRSGDTGRSVYRIELETGRTIKARRMNDEATARQLFDIRRDLPAAFTPAFGRHGSVLLEDWIEGTELGDACPSDAHAAEAGALLAQLHSRTAVAGQLLHELRSTGDWRERTEQGLHDLLAAGGLDAQAVPPIRAALERHDPKRAIFGLVHSDFCGENMVVDGSGRLHVVDNERLRVDALGFDVGRSWYRWALPPRVWECFGSAYAAGMPFTEPLETLGFWSLVAVVKSAVLRMRLDPARAHVPLDRLRRMAFAQSDRRAQR